MPANQRPGPGVPGQFPNQGPMAPHPQSPYRARASPAMAPAAMQQQMHMMNNQNMPQGGYAAYPAHLQPQQVRSHPLFSRRSFSEATPVVSVATRRRKVSTEAADTMREADILPPSSSSQSTVSFLTHKKAQGMYGMPNQYDQAYAYYPGNPYVPHMPYGGAPPGDRSFSQPPHGQPGYMPGQYGNPPHGQSMSRTPSQVSERPPSTLGQPPTPATNHSHTPSASSNSPAPSATKSQFTIPTKSKGIVIKNPEGEVVTFDKKSSSPAPQASQQNQPPSRSPSRAPVVVSSSSTPPTNPQHSRTESKAKTDAEKKLDFQEQVKKQLEAEAKKKAEEEKAAKEKAEAEAKAKEKEEAEKAAKAQAEVEAAKKASEDDEKAKAEEKKRQEDEEFERMVAEMEAQEKEEEEKERKFQEQKAKAKEEEEKKKKAKEASQNTDEALKAAEREAEELEAKKEAEAQKGAKTDDKEAAALFASLKRPTLGPGANASAPAPQPESGASTPASEKMPPPPSRQISSGPPSAGRPKPAHLRLETSKPVEPPQPTPGMQALKSARFIHLQSEIMYPEGIKSPNPALNSAPKKNNGQRYDKSFLLQFQDAFKEKPSVDWDSRVKETVGDTDSARPQSARTPMNSRASRASLPAGGIQSMGNFQGANAGRTLPPGTTSQDRFAASQMGGRPASGMGTNPFSHFVKPGGGFPMGGAPSMSRTNSLQTMTPGSPRVGGSQRGKGGSRRGPGLDKSQSHRNEERDAKTMPLTAGQEVKPLEASGGGWKPTSIGTRPAAAPAAGIMAPDLVQRKVKAALNKMTPEKFDRIADQILEIASQSKDESDGRTLRQVIALTFEKACDEAHWASMYAQFCQRMLQTMSPEIKDESVRDKQGNLVVGGALFRKYLLNRCQEEFERGWEVNMPPRKEGETEEAAMLSDEYYVAAAAKRRGLGLVQFIGELYKLGMLTLRIMHECVHKLLNFEGIPDEGSVESLVKLLRTIGAMMESSEQGQNLLNSYFDRIERTMNMEGLPSRLHFMLLDTVDLRRSGWKSREQNKGPKTIQEIHAEAAKAQQQAESEKQRQNQRGGRPQMGRGDARNMMPPPDYQRNTVGIDDLRRLNRGSSGRNTGSTGSLGPPSMLGSRSNSGRNNSRLGPGGNLKGGDDSGNSSRTNTPPVKAKQESTSHINAFE
jgi:translation initiation factor 4G